MTLIKRKPLDQTILIIGAGICGLYTADQLLGLGYQVVIVEGRDRLGGRIHTLQGEFTGAVDAGAEFIHGQQPITMKLLTNAKGNRVHRAGNHYTLVKDEIHHGDLMDEQWEAFFHKLNTQAYDITLAAFLQDNFSGPEFADLRRGVTRFAEGFDIADTQRASALTLRDEWAHTDNDDQYHIQEGYRVIIDHLEQKIRRAGGIIHLSEPVSMLEWSEGSVVTETSTGRRIVSGRAIVTVPLGVLQRKDIRFIPAIDQHQKALDQMGFGGVIKFLFEFKERFWESTGRQLSEASFILSDAEIPTWWTPLPDTRCLITGWLGGPGTFATDHDVAALYRRAIDSLAYITHVPAAEIESHIVHWHIADWTQDPFARGAYSFPTLETRQAVSLLSTPVENTIYFAGEAIYDGASGGTVEAALASSEAVVSRLHSSLHQ